MNLVKLSLFTLFLLFSAGIQRATAQYDSLEVVLEYEGMLPIEFTPDSKFIIGYRNPNIVVVDVETGETVKTFFLGYYEEYDVLADLSPDGNYLAVWPTGNYNVNIFLWDFLKGEPLDTIKRISNGFRGLNFTADSKYISIPDGYGSTSLELVDFITGTHFKNIPTNAWGTAISVDFSKDGRYVAISWRQDIPPHGDINCLFEIMDLQTAEQIFEYSNDYGLDNVKFADNDNLIFTDGVHRLKKINIPNKTTETIIENHWGIYQFDISPDGKYLVVGAAPPIEIWDLMYNQLTFKYKIDKGFAICSPNSEFIASYKYLLNAQYIPTSVIKDDIKTDILYPNPTNNIVNIDCSLNSSSQLSIDIFDNNGIKLTTIFNGLLAQGNNSIPYNCINLSNGVYFIKISSPHFTKTFKLIKE